MKREAKFDETAEKTVKAAVKDKAKAVVKKELKKKRAKHRKSLLKVVLFVLPFGAAMFSVGFFLGIKTEDVKAFVKGKAVPEKFKRKLIGRLWKLRLGK